MYGFVWQTVQTLKTAFKAIQKAVTRNTRTLLPIMPRGSVLYHTQGWVFKKNDVFLRNLFLRFIKIRIFLCKFYFAFILNADFLKFYDFKTLYLILKVKTRFYAVKAFL